MMPGMPTPTVPSSLIPTTHGRSWVVATPDHATWTNLDTYVRVHTPQSVVGSWLVEAKMTGDVRSSWLAAMVAGTCGTLDGRQLGVTGDGCDTPAGIGDAWSMSAMSGPVCTSDAAWVNVARGTDDARPILTGVYVDPATPAVDAVAPRPAHAALPLTLAATDSYRLHTLADPAGTYAGWSGMLVAGPTFAACHTLRDVHVGTVAGIGHVPFPAATGYTASGVCVQVTGRPIEGQYPPYRNLIPTNATARFEVDTRTLAALTAGAATWLGKTKRSSKDPGADHHVRVTVDDRGAAVVCRVQAVGAVWHPVPGADVHHAEPIMVAFNARFLAGLPSCTTGGITTVAGTDSLKPWLFTTGNRTGLIMPVRCDWTPAQGASTVRPADCALLPVTWPKGVTAPVIADPATTPAPVAEPTPTVTPAPVKAKRTPAPRRPRTPAPVADVPAEPTPPVAEPVAEPAPVVLEPTPADDAVMLAELRRDMTGTLEVLAAVRAELAELRASLVDATPAPAPTPAPWTPTPATTTTDPAPVDDETPAPVDDVPYATDWTDRAPVATMTRPIPTRVGDYLARLMSPAKAAYAASLVDAWRNGMAPRLDQANVWAADVEHRLARYGVTFP